MENAASSNPVDEADPSASAPATTARVVDGATPDPTKDASQSLAKKKDGKKQHGRSHLARTHKRSGKRSKRDPVSSSDDSSSSPSSSSDSDLSSDSDSDSDEPSRRKSHKRASRSKQTKGKKKKSKHISSDSSSDDSSSDSSSGSSSDGGHSRRRTRNRAAKRGSRDDDDDDSDGSSYDEDGSDDANEQDNAGEIARLKEQLARLELRTLPSRRSLGKASRRATREKHNDKKRRTRVKKPKASKKRSKSKKKSVKKASTLEFKRVDQLWDSSIHDYKLTESAETQEDEFEQYIFTVRRKFDWENKYKSTVVDIKSKPLREVLQEVMKDVKGVSLVEEQPSVDPNMLFLYLEELRTFTKKTLRARAKSEKKKKVKRNLKAMRAHCKVLLEYLDEDYDETKKTLYPMLEAGNITFDLLWALFKPNTIAFTSTYGSAEHPRAFKVDYANRESSFMRGEWYCIEGRYLEYDGKSFGLGDFEVDIDNFKGPRKITSLSTYPLEYHKDPEGIKKQLIERGKQFVALEGMNYRFHKGLAFMKKKKTVAKVNINGRIMVDPAIFRRMNPNYPISVIRPKDQGHLFGGDDDDDSSCCCDDEEEDDDDEAPADGEGPASLEAAERTKYKVVFDDQHKAHVVEVPVDAEGNELQVENIEKLPENVDAKREFSEEELLLASPVVFGFAFSEKLWLEFSLSGVCEIEWNEGAFNSLVLPPNQKSIIRALVESHKFDAAKTIDDVVQGKGRGLVAVLHGPPGTGKTLTAEGIAELLKCPLYMVSAGELGTDPRMLEHELQKILDIAHSWGAVLLLDEADVFLEKREVHDIHRNALVSIFLRLLEYFQGILFLTTNRVETFDDAFQSRIHVALRYGELTTKAKRTVWKMFLERVKVMETQLQNESAATEGEGEGEGSAAASAHDTPTSSSEVVPTRKAKAAEPTNFGDADYDYLARRNMNGRQIKNAVRTAQALAVNERTPMTMEHIKRVLDVAESFDRDLRGGTGYTDAMRSYT